MQAGTEPLFAPVCIFSGVALRRSMYIPALIRSLTVCTSVLVSSSLFSEGQGLSDQAAHNRQTLQYNIFLSRRGVRSPTK
jgi:hypothetical protein